MHPPDQKTQLFHQMETTVSSRMPDDIAAQATKLVDFTAQLRKEVFVHRTEIAVRWEKWRAVMLTSWLRNKRRWASARYVFQC